MPPKKNNKRKDAGPKGPTETPRSKRRKTEAEPGPSESHDVHDTQAYIPPGNVCMNVL